MGAIEVGNAASNVSAMMPKAKVKYRSGSGQLGPYLALLLFMAIYCARPQDWVPGLKEIPVAKLAGLLILAALVLSVRNLTRRLPSEVVYLILLTLQLFVAAILSPLWIGGALDKALDFAKASLIVLVMVVSVQTMARLQLLILVQAFSVAFVAAASVWKGFSIEGRLLGLLGGYYTDPNDLALTAAISLPLCLAMLLLARDWLWKAAWTVAILTTIYAIFLTGSRGGFLTLIVTGAVGVWKFGIQRRKYLVLLVSVVAGIVFWLSSASLLSERLKGTFDEKGADNAEAYTSWQYRQKYFWTSIEVTRQHPFFGVGPGNFQQLSGDWHETHNSFTQMSSEGGLPALVLYVAILWCGFKNLWAARRFAESSRRVRILTDAIHISLVGYVIGSAFLSVAYQLFPYFLVAYTTALVSVGRRSYLKARAKKTAGEPEYPHTVFSPALSQFGPTS